MCLGGADTHSTSDVVVPSGCLREAAENSPARKLEKRTGCIANILASDMYLKLSVEGRQGIFVPNAFDLAVSKRRWEQYIQKFRADVRELCFREWKENSVISGAGVEFEDRSCGSSTKGLWDLESVATHHQ